MKKLFIISFLLLLTFSITSCAKENIIVADASLYRGTVTEVENDYVVLTQVEGRDYGEKSIKFLLDDNTKYNKSKRKLKADLYVEIYYAGSIEVVEPFALAVNILGDVEKLVFNGVVTEVKQIDKSSGTFIIKDSVSNVETEIYYNNDGTTNFYMNIDELKTGVTLSIFSTGKIKDSKVVASEVLIIY